MLLIGEEKLDAAATERLASLLALGDPGAEVAIAYRVKERLRDFYRTADPDQARQILQELEEHCRRRTMPPEIQKLGRTIGVWFDKINTFCVLRVSCEVSAHLQGLSDLHVCSRTALGGGGNRTDRSVHAKIDVGAVYIL